MFSIEITDPRSIAYPFSKELYDDPLVVYHGTSSAYAPSIERDGLRTGAAPFDRAAFKTIVEAYQRIGLIHLSATLLGACALDSKRDEATGRAIYFSQRFWHALEYAGDIGGESVKNALKAATNFREFSTDPELRRRLLEQHQEQVRLAGESGRPEYAHQPLSQAEHLRDDKFMQELTGRIGIIEDKLRKSIEGSYPVVYAVRVEREWFDDWEDPVMEGGFCFSETNMDCQRNVPTGCLIARASYINGLEDSDAGFHNLSHIQMNWEQAHRRQRFST